MSRYSAHLVPTDHLEDAWPQAEPFVEMALRYNLKRRTTDDVKESLDSGDSQLWLIYTADDGAVHAACVTEIIDYPRKRVLDLCLMGGIGMTEWLCLLPRLEAWAKGVIGCDQIQIQGRPGWGRVTSYPEASRLYVKELCDG